MGLLKSKIRRPHGYALSRSCIQSVICIFISKFIKVIHGTNFTFVLDKYAL